MSLTTRLLNHFKNRIARLILVPSDGGRFEITVDGDTVYSKLETGSFPSEPDLIKEIEQRK